MQSKKQQELSKAFAEISGALSNVNRVRILEYLATYGPMCAQDLLKVFDLSQPTMSQHIKVLRDNGLLIPSKEGRFQYFAVNTRVLKNYIEKAQSLFVRNGDRFVDDNPIYQNGMKFYKR